MICIQLMGGLGNQMFQYACGKALSQRLNTELVLDTTRLQMKKKGAKITFRSFELNIFKLNTREAEKFEILKLKPILYRIINVFYIRLGFSGIQISKYFIEKNFSYNTTILKVSSNCFISGYWQSPYYFQSIETLIREDFKFKNDLDQKNSTHLNFILNSCSVSLHIRRTDFLNIKSHDIHGICSLEYYNNAIEFISKKVCNAHFMIFSDDIEWAKENLKMRFPCSFVSGNIGDKSYIDMQLMSSCKHNIIANSSFSWWGAWLNGNNDKIIIAPKQWFLSNNMNEQTSDLIPDTWIRL
jgi:hypothetical protein